MTNEIVELVETLKQAFEQRDKVTNENNKFIMDALRRTHDMVDKLTNNVEFMGNRIVQLERDIRELQEKKVDSIILKE